MSDPVYLLLKIMLISFSLNVFAAVNINTATLDELQTLEGIGPVKAEEIIKYRTKYGVLKNIKALGNIPGMGLLTIEMNKSNISFGDDLFYTVTRGDNLSKIAKIQYGRPNHYIKIFEANKSKLNNPNKIYTGQILQIPH